MAGLIIIHIIILFLALFLFYLVFNIIKLIKEGRKIDEKEKEIYEKFNIRGIEDECLY